MSNNFDNENKQPKTKINIGFDIGVTSVGWSIVDENYNIIDMGVRLFDDVANPKDGKLKNAKRRESRSARRRITRARLRKHDYINFLINKGWIKNDEQEIFDLINIDITKFGVDNPIELKVKALNKYIPKEQLIYILFHYLHHRGFFYEQEDESTNKSKQKTKHKKTQKDDNLVEDNKEASEVRKENEIKFDIDKSKTPSQNIYGFYLKYHYYKNAPINDKFSNEDYVKEVKLILNNQLNYDQYKNEIKSILSKENKTNITPEVINKYISDFIDEYINIFKRARKFSDGPGIDLYNNSNWSVYKRDKKTNEYIKLENGQYDRYDCLWEKTIGMCTYFKDQYRGYKKAPKTQIFNFLNDLNRLKIDSKSLSKEQKEIIFNNLNKLIKDNGKKISLTTENLIFKPLEIVSKEHEISGLRISGDISKDSAKKSGKLSYEIADIKKYIDILLFLKKYELEDFKNVDIFNNNDGSLLNIINDLFGELAKKNDYKERVNYLYEKYPSLKYKDIKNENEPESELSLDIKKMLKDSSFSTTSALSYKAMDKYINYVLKNLDDSVEQMQYFYNNEKFQEELKHQNNSNESKEEPLNNFKYIKKGLFDDAILSPTVRRAFNQNIAVLNAILKKYVNNKNNNYEIDNITFELPRDSNSSKERKKFEKIQKSNRDKINEILKNNGKNLNDIELTLKQKTRLKLWESTNGFDVYDGQKIDFEDALSGKGLEIDHIIPFHISNMDSLDNKVLTKQHNNQLKKERTPFQWFESSDNNHISFDKFKDVVEKNVISKTKKKWLLFEGDPMNNKGFIERNLVDTRYAARLVLNTVQSFFKDNKHYANMHVKSKVINGSLTNYARNNLFVEKSGNKNKPVLPKDRDIYHHHAIDASIVCYLGMNYWVKNQILRKKLWQENNNPTIKDGKIDTSEFIGKIVDHKSGEVIDLNIDIFGRDISKKNNCELDESSLKDSEQYQNKQKFQQALIKYNPYLIVSNDDDNLLIKGSDNVAKLILEDKIKSLESLIDEKIEEFNNKLNLDVENDDEELELNEIDEEQDDENEDSDNGFEKKIKTLNSIKTKLTKLLNEVESNYSIDQNVDNDVISAFNKLVDKYLNVNKQLINDNNLVKFSRLVTHISNTSLTKETIYSIKKIDDEKCDIISKIHLLRNSEKDISKKELDKYFKITNNKLPRDALKLLINADDRNENNKVLYQELCKIYNAEENVDYKKDKKGESTKTQINPFMVYMNKNYKELIKPSSVIFELNGNKHKISKLKLKTNKKPILLNNVMILKKHNNKAIMQSFNSFSLNIYKNDKGDFVVIPVNAQVLDYSKSKKRVDVSKVKLDEILKNQNISNKKYVRILFGTHLINKSNDQSIKNKLFYISGYSSANKVFELKSISMDNMIILSIDRIGVALSSLVENYDLVDVDVLGNVYNRRNIKNML